MRLLRSGLACLFALGLSAGGVCAQEAGQGAPVAGMQATGVQVPQSRILVIDFERAYAESAFGRGMAEEIRRESAAIAAENRRIEAELVEEEKRLTAQRAATPPREFRKLAEAFDEKVQRLRAEQDIKTEAVGRRGDQSRIDFLAAARPVLEGLMRAAGATVVLERRSVLVVMDAIDITDAAIARIDAQVGAAGDAGTTAPETPADPAPQPPLAPASQP
ncbi:OmpH family outer membrane protein [Sagittula sp. M10.9X]|uniref:OmpH family outer membrane protein n=2 Tax=Sagittula salina TaxID=2820268 RepID=A0A940MQN7_9RHOB|nr:OmpH family outer membrane protein [Sagittula salina]